MGPAIDCDVVVIGSGPGGATSAALLAEAGFDVIIVEEGPALTLDSCDDFSIEEIRTKYRSGGITAALGKPRIPYVEATCVGGGSEINSGLYHRAPEDVLLGWRESHQTRDLLPTDLESHHADIEHELSVSRMSAPPPRSSLLLQDGASALGWQCIEVPRWFKRDPATGVDRKQSMSETFIPRALRAGARLVPNTRAVQILRQRGRWAVRATRPGSDGRQVEHKLSASCVFVCGGAIQSAALLARSGLSRMAGRSLQLHATAKITALFATEVNDRNSGVPVHQVKEFSPAIALGGSISQPPHLHLALLDLDGGQELVANSWPRMATYYAMIREGAGTVRSVPGIRDPIVRFSVGKRGLQQLLQGMERLGECLLAAGATALFPSTSPCVAVSSLSELRQFLSTIGPSKLNAMTIHLMGTCPMGEDRERCAVDSFGRLHGHEGIYVNDASMLPTSLGVNPQGTLMAVAARNARSFISSGPDRHAR
jgi:choline dehydrogenase-like flavoprotein